MFADLPAQENHLFFLAVDQGAEFLAHAVAHHHIARHLGGPFQVVGGAGADFLEADFFGGASAQRKSHVVEYLVALHQVAILLWQRERVPARHPARHDGDFAHGVAFGQHVGDQGVSRLVVGHDLALLFGDDAAAPLRPGDDALDGLLEFAHADALPTPARCENCSFVDGVLDVGADEARCGLRQQAHIHAGIHGLAAHVDAEDGLAPANIWLIQDDAAVEASGTE